MLKLAGVMLVITCGALLGNALSALIKLQEKELQLIMEFFRQFAVLLRIGRASPEKIISTLFMRGIYKESVFLNLLNESVDTKSDFSTWMLNALGGINKKQRKVLEQCLSPLRGTIGVRMLEEQQTALYAADELLQQAVYVAGQHSGKTCEMYTKLGILVGLMAAVLLF